MGYDKNNFSSALNKIIDSFKREIAGIRTNRPSSALVEDIKVSYYGQMLPVKQLGSIGVTPPREIYIQIWDKDAASHVLKAIEASQLGLSPRTEGNIIRIYLPELSQERRDELKKHVRRISEQYRIQVRHERDEANRNIEKMKLGGEITEDKKFSLKEEIQKLTDKANEKIEGLVKTKTKEIDE